jgi:hypothetical protein
MKTSTKLIIIFCSFFPVSLLAYNYLIKVEFTKRNFVREFSPDATQTYSTYNVGKFKHIVIDGALQTADAERLLTWRPMIAIKSNSHAKLGNQIEALKFYQDRVRTKLKNDTLFVWFVTSVNYKNLNENNDWGNEALRISVNGVTSVDTKYANVNIADKPSAFDSLKLTMMGGGRYDLNKINTYKLTITAADSSFYNIYKDNRITNLHYSLLDKSTINLDEHPVKQFHADRLDTSAKIQITDKALYLQKQLH